MAEKYGICLTHVYRILSNKVHYDPNYHPENLAKRPRITRWVNSALNQAEVESLRKLRRERWVSNSILSRMFKVPDTVIYDCLMNNSYFDPDYSPEDLKPREALSGVIRTFGYIYGLVCKCENCTRAGLGVQYVGQTTRSLKSRLADHRKPYGSDKYTDRGRWVTEHGSENIEIVELEKDPEEGLDEAEIKWIQNLNTLKPNGKNSTPGGYSGAGRPGEKNPGAKLTELQVREIIEEIGTNPSVRTRELKERYGVSNVTILNIDSGRSWATVPRPYGRNLLGRRRNRL